MTTASLRIVIAGGLGDCLLHTPFIRYFALSGRYDHITCMARRDAIELFDRNPYISTLIGCEGSDLALWALPEQDSDVFAPYIQGPLVSTRGAAVEQTGCFRIKCRGDWQHAPGDAYIVRQIARRYGISLTDESLDVFTAPEDEQWAEGFTEVFAGKPIVALNRRTASGAKEYPRESWQAVVSALAPRAAMLEFGAPSEALAGAQCIWPFQPLRRTAALLRRVRCLVTVDSLAAHLATAVGTPAVVVFGPSNPAVFGHPGNRNVRRAPCEPCYNPFEAGCTEPVCLNQLPPQTIIDAALAELSRAPQVSRKAAGRAEGVCHVR